MSSHSVRYPERTSPRALRPLAPWARVREEPAHRMIKTPEPTKSSPPAATGRGTHENIWDSPPTTAGNDEKSSLLFLFLWRCPHFPKSGDRGGADGGFLFAPQDRGQPFDRAFLSDFSDDIDVLGFS